MEEKIIKRNYEKNFQKYLWNQYDNLHDRLTRKIGSLSKILSSINDIHHVKKEYYKSLKPLIKDEPQPLSEEENFRQTMVIIKNNNEKFIEFEDEMYSEIIDKIRSLIEKMKQEKFLYDDFKKALDYYNGEKAKMEKFKNIYHTNGKIAERSTLYYKDLQIKRKINDQNIMNQSIDKSKIDCKNRLIGLSKDCSNYIQSLKNVNKIRKEVNKKQDNLLSVYQELEWDDKNLYADVMEIIWKYQKKVYDYTGKQLNEVEIIQNAIHIDKDIRGLVEKLRKYETPEEEILYEHYPTEVDFDKCQDIKDYRVCDAIVKEMKSYVEGIFENYDEKLEDKKNRFRDLIIKFFDKNRQTTEDDKKQLLEFVEDTRTHGIFLIVLAKLRTNNRFCRDRFLIELLSDIMLKLLDNAQKINDFSIAKNCLILSQTFFFYDENDKNKKIYISNYIKKHPWLQSPRFWGDFILRQILSEFNKVEERNKGIERMIISLRKCVPENMKPRIGEVLFSQLLPYVGNMNEVEVDKKVTIKIVDSILEKFPFIEETNKVEIYKMICAAEEVPKFKEQIQNDESLKNFSLDVNIVKEFNKGKKFIDADDYDDF